MIATKITGVWICAMLCTTFLSAQTLNWERLTASEQKHLANLNFGLEHGVIYGMAYGYQLPARRFPMLATVNFSMPSGGDAFDDFKTRIGVDVNLLQINHFRFSAKLQAIFRRTQNDFVRLNNFGSELSGALGYYRSGWFFAAEAGFDKAISTHFKHRSAYRTSYPKVNVQDGWYEPATGGNFYYGVQTGFSFGRNDIYLKAGRMLTQDFKTAPLVPFYGQLGYNRRF
jgi:hypothetical protein